MKWRESWLTINHILLLFLLSLRLLSDADDQTGAGQRPGPAGAELGTLPAQVPPQEPHQAQGTQEEEREEGVHTVPSITAREQGGWTLVRT